MENTVIKVLTKEHGAKVIEWWKSQVESTYGYTGTLCESDGVICESEGYESIYYGVIDHMFDNYSAYDVSKANAKIIELPEEEFDMTTNEGRLAYAKKHYPVGTRYIPLDYKTGHTYPQSCESRFIPQVTICPYADYYNDLDAGNGFIYVHKLNKWAEIIKEEKVMETQKLTRAGLKEIHSVACSYWKGKLEGMGIRNPLEDYIELTQEEVDAMFKACTKDQLPIVSKYLKQDDGSVDLSKITGAFRGGNYEAMIVRRMEKEYANKSFWLNSSYNWEIKKDTDNILCLIPTKKK
jgi:hypothetical protein